MKIVAPLHVAVSSAELLVKPYEHGGINTKPPSSGGGVVTDPTDPGTFDPTAFVAFVSSAPSNGSTISGHVTIKIVGQNIRNVELLPEFGYSPKYGSFTISADFTTATLTWDTTTLSNRTQKFRVSAFNVPPNSSGAEEIVVFTRTWSIANGASSTPGVSPSSIVVDGYGDSTMRGWNGGTHPPEIVSNTYTVQLANAYSGMVARNEGVNQTSTTDLINGTDGVPRTWAAQMDYTNATHVLINHGINDWIDEATYKNNLTTLVNGAKNKSKIPILVTPNPTYLTLSGGTTAGDAAIDQRAGFMREVATALNVPIIDLHKFAVDYMAANGITRSTWTPDGIHPDSTAYGHMGKYLVERFGAITGLTAGSEPAPAPAPAPDGGTGLMRGPAEVDFDLTFFEGFDGSSLDRSKWADGLWYDRGIPSGTLRLANSELQMTGNPDTMFTGKDDTGYCVITTDPTSLQPTHPGFQQRYGVFQVEALMPAGKGYWPSFWIFGHHGNFRPEIDIYEAYPGGQWDWTYPGNVQTSTDYPSKPFRADISIHCKEDTGGGSLRDVHPKRDTNMFNGMVGSAAFHTYTLEWDQSYMKFYLDGNLVWNFTESSQLQFFAQYQLFLIIGLGINYGTAGGPSTDSNITPRGFSSDPANPGPGVYRVKYCAAWQHKKYRN